MPLLTYIMSGLRSSPSQTEPRQMGKLDWSQGVVLMVREERCLSNCPGKIIPPCPPLTDCELSFPPKALSRYIFSSLCSPSKKAGRRLGLCWPVVSPDRASRVRTRRSQHRHHHDYHNHQALSPGTVILLRLPRHGQEEQQTTLHSLLSSVASCPNHGSYCSSLTWHNLPSLLSLNPTAPNNQRTFVSATHEFFPLEDFEI